jgi:CRP-like cAMP-binding protein
VTPSSIADRLGPTAVRRLVMAALLLAAVALGLCLMFVLRTSGGTVFLFSMAAPPLLAVAIAAVGAAMLIEYRRAHRLFSLEHHPVGHVIFRQGEPGDCAYFIRAGRVEVVDERTSAVLAALGPGDYFGEMALLDGAPRNATVRTLAPVELAVLGKDNFLHMLRLLPAAEQEVLGTIRERAMAADSAADAPS